ncbi:MAG: NmrA family NAD(P)-binding protein [Actinoplanes sp.]
MTETTLLIGGNGKTGRRVASRLAAHGIDVRIGSRSGAPRFDWADEGSWAEAFHGVGAAYLTYYPDLALPGAAERVGAVAELAARSGVEQLVLLSGRNEELAQEAERRVQAAGTGWTIVSCSWFAQNFSEEFLVADVLRGVITAPAGDTVEPFVDAEDIADVVAAALTDPKHRGNRYELTGGRALGFAAVAAELSLATGRDISYAPVSDVAYELVLRDAGLPVELGEMFRSILDGRNAVPQDGVREALGRAPRDFGDYARRTAATGVWDVPPLR